MLEGAKGIELVKGIDWVPMGTQIKSAVIGTSEAGVRQWRWCPGRWNHPIHPPENHRASRCQNGDWNRRCFYRPWKL